MRIRYLQTMSEPLSFKDYNTATNRDNNDNTELYIRGIPSIVRFDSDII